METSFCVSTKFLFPFVTFELLIFLLFDDFSARQLEKNDFFFTNIFFKRDIGFKDACRHCWCGVPALQMALP